ncbi:MAG: hypothetical protein ACLPV4_23325 [Solirubrobacteraceae bacterium]
MDADEQREYLRQQLMDACTPLVRKAAMTLELDTADVDVCTAVMDLCMGVFNAGMRAGCAQILAQLAEQGVDFKFNMDSYLLTDEAD